MRVLKSLLLTTCFALGAHEANAAQATAGNCPSLVNVAFASTTISSATLVNSGTIKTPGGVANITKPFCRVQAVSRPTPDSEILFEVWLPPTAEAWNKRMNTEATGGFLGGIPVARLAQMLETGFAAVGTNLGHDGGESATWALGHPEKVNDYAWRSHYYVANTAKAVIAAFYGQPAKKAYFNGCSGGGRQGQMMAQRYPDLYDGIIVGAPTMFYSDDILSIIWHGINHRDPEKFEMIIPESKLPMITADVLSICDAKDGLKDGEITDPRACTYDAKRLLCKGADAPNCLTQQQVDIVNATHRGLHRGGSPITPGPSIGSEFLWRQTASLGMQGGYGDFIGHYVYNQKDFNWRKIDFEKDYDTIKNKLDPIMAASSPDLQRFKARGGKIIQYHGWNDPARLDETKAKFTPREIADLVLGENGVSDYYRVFMLPGMAHCTGGSGPININQQPTAQSPSTSPDVDVVSALVRWVEDGVAPEQIIATQYKEGDASKGIQRQRPLCAYPKAAKYKGSGDINDAKNFTCVPRSRAFVTPGEADMAQIRNALKWRGQLTPAAP